MLIDIERLKFLFLELEIILKKENDDETLYIINQTNLSVLLINECLNNSYTNKDLLKLLIKLKKIYAEINQPRIGLSDYFIWRDNYEERINANKDLDTIKQ